jgi:radical SAM superfamily enzyme YgiQ (UPF0313 family)
MAKVLLFTIHDINASDIRLIGAFLQKCESNTVHLVLLGNDSHASRSQTIPDNWLHSTGGSSSAAHRFASNLFVNNYTFSDFTISPAFLCYIQSWQPNIVGYSGTPETALYCSELFAAIRTVSPNILIVASGFGPSTNPEFYLDAKADIVVRGECEETFAELTECLEHKSSWARIRNISWKTGDQYNHNPLRPLLTDLDSLPVQLLNVPGIFHIKNGCMMEEDPLFCKEQSIAYVATSRGCIRTCSYCAMTSWHKMYTCQGLVTPKYRKHSIEYILQEIQIRKALGQTAVFISDQCFFRPPQEMLEFLQRYKQEICLPIGAANFLPSVFNQHPEIFDAAIDAGLQRVSIQVQSGDGDLCERIFARKNDYPLLLKIARQAADKYLVVHTDLIDGYIFNEQDDLDTKLKFICDLPTFDPKFPYSTIINILYLHREAGTPLDHMWSELNVRWLSGRDFAYRVMLMQLRYILDDDEFATLFANKRYKDDPRPLASLNHALRYAKHKTYILEHAKLLTDQKVWFWGCGKIYQACKDFFFGCRPQGMLLNVENNLRGLDGMKIYSAEDILYDGEQLPIVIFSSHAQKIAQKIKRIRPDYKHENIIACQNIGWQNVSF